VTPRALICSYKIGENRAMRTTCPASPFPSSGVASELRRGGARRLRDERGAVLVHVAVAFTGLLAFSALSIDLGVLWAARRQAQNAADSAAMAGALSLAYVDPSNEDQAREAARAVAAAHEVWGQSVADAAVDFGPCPTGSPSTAGACVQVAVARSAASGSPLPTYIAPLFGFSAASVEARGSAKVLIGNSTNCLKPLALVDRWTDTHDDAPPIDGALTEEDSFDRYVETRGRPESELIADPDVYAPPGPAGPGSGYGYRDVGQQVLLEVTDPLGALRLTGMALLAQPTASPTGDVDVDFAQNMAGCSPRSVSVGDTVDMNSTIHPRTASESAERLIDADPSAWWDGTRVVGSRATSALSPRIIAVAVFDPDAYRQTDRRGAVVSLVVRNIVGLFLNRVVGEDIEAFLVPLPGQFNPAAGQLSDDTSFLRTVALVR
jgi:Flp pilus assembly protein TadG